MEKLAAEGDFGLGTFNRVDGELIVVDGTVYQARPGGEAAPAPMDEKIPFAAVVRFTADGSLPLADIASLDALAARLDEGVDTSRMLAVRIDATFATATVRAVAPQSPPYRPLPETLKEQVVVTLENVKGTMVGFRFPSWIGGVNAPGWHFHFMDADRKRGGHLLNVSLAKGTATFDAKAGLDLTPASLTAPPSAEASAPFAY
ncbi:MAG: acetolactate decarboxylase [Nitrospinae bacterium]|nr:acetolactate decarboxylase [Nitrospinota bacterium]